MVNDGVSRISKQIVWGIFYAKYGIGTVDPFDPFEMDFINEHYVSAAKRIGSLLDY